MVCAKASGLRPKGIIGTHVDPVNNSDKALGIKVGLRDADYTATRTRGENQRNLRPRSPQNQYRVDNSDSLYNPRICS